MSYNISHRIDNDLIRVDFTGIWPKHHPETPFADIMKLWVDAGKQHLLVCDLRQQENSPDMGTDFIMANYFSENGFNRIAKVAVLDKPEYRKLNDINELLLNNRGCNVRFFYEEGHALDEWLSEKSSA